MDATKVDYSLYLVTDSTPAILGSKNLPAVVEAALEGGVTIVQYRDKVSDTADLIATARKLHVITQKYNVPLLINDRIDVALAVGCEGVHIGQDDMNLTIARKLLGNSAIIGVTCASIEEAQIACRDGADYIGIGTMFATQTKTNTKSVLGTAGTKKVLEAIASETKVRTVSIGGINASNVQRVLYQSNSPSKSLDGVAIVSAIIAAADPTAASQELKKLINSAPPFASSKQPSTQASDTNNIISIVPSIIKKVGQVNPLCHNMTNLVVQNFAANVALQIGASPIMANYGEEAADLCQLGGALVINMGTVTPEGLENYLMALKAYNLVGGPVVFDPVGAGATAIRRNAVKTLMVGGYFDLIKGNEAEIKTVLGQAGAGKGVDSGASTLDGVGKARLVQELAARERNVVLMTGTVDYVSDGQRTFAISNGHEYLGRITGSGCVLGTIVAAMMATHKEDKLLAAVAGILHYEIAAEVAAEREDVKGPGTFVPALLDELYHIQQAAAKNEQDWVKRVKIEAVNLA